MAQTQKYFGKVLTPWMNSTEWTEARDLIFSNNIENQKSGLSILKTWKLRTPLLSAGIEGTLILLEALLEDLNHCTDYKIAQIYSTALLRFLNICAAHNKNQGTFYKTAQKNDLPNWLISIRHDIAHDYRIPSRKKLQCALNLCFEWVQEKYWNIQHFYMKDYVVWDGIDFNEMFYNYTYLKLLYFYKEQTNEICSNIKDKYKKVIPELDHYIKPEKLISILENSLWKFINDKVKDSDIHIISTLVEKQIILSVCSCVIDNVKRIPLDFQKIWYKIFNSLYENGNIFLLMKSLADVTSNNSYDNSMKEIASLWIVEFYLEFMKLKEKKENMELEVLDSGKDIFNVNYELPIVESKLFQEYILKRPTKYTLNYLEIVLRFNGNNKKIIKEKIEFIEKLLYIHPTFKEDSHLSYKANGIQDVLNNFMDYDTMDKLNINQEQKFKRLTNAEKRRFQGYPLGIIPPSGI